MKRQIKGAHRWRASLTALAVVALTGAGLGTALLSAGGAGASGASAVNAKAAAAPPLFAPAKTVAAGNGAASRAAVVSYWTPQRMASAKPAEVALTASPGAAQAVNAGPSATGTPGLAGGYVPAGSSTVASPAVPVNHSLKSSSVLPADGGYPGPNDTYNWMGAQTQFPVAAVGKLFFTEPSGNFVCSATATFGNNTEKDMVWTAGHCVGAQGGRQYYTNFLFCPQYNNGESSAGCWTYALAQQTGGWYFNGYWSADYAYLYMNATGDKKANHVVSVTGGLGLAWNWSRDQFWQDFGYPSGSPYGGGKLVVTSAEHRYDVTNPGSDPGPQDDSIGSQQTPGFSGGPWILSFGHNSATDPQSHGDWINGENSYYFTSGGPGGGNEYGTEIQSPYYDTNACNFWKGGSKWTGSC